MVKLRDHIAALLRLLRWQNLLIVAATQILIRQCILVPLLKQAYMEPQLSLFLFILLVVSTVFITAGGYAINDYFDRKIDRVNKPDDVIVGNLIFPRHAMAYHLIFSLSGVVLGILLSLLAKQLYLSLVFFIVSGLLWFYSTTYKREFLLGNFIVALLTALVPFLVLLFELPLLARSYGSDVTPLTRYLIIWFMGFSLFAFLLNLIREIIKDAIDFEGDMAFGKKTIPVVWGINSARWISVILSLATIGLLVSAWILFIRDYITLVYFTVMVIFPLCVVIYMLCRAGYRNMFKKISLLLKITMVGGLGYMIVANLIINHLK